MFSEERPILTNPKFASLLYWLPLILDGAGTGAEKYISILIPQLFSQPLVETCPKAEEGLPFLHLVRIIFDLLNDITPSGHPLIKTYLPEILNFVFFAFKGEDKFWVQITDIDEFYRILFDVISTAVESNLFPMASFPEAFEMLHKYFVEEGMAPDGTPNDATVHLHPPLLLLATSFHVCLLCV